MKFEAYDYYIGAHFVPYLINGDASNLSDSEHELIEKYEATLIAARPNTSAHWAMPEGEPYFAVCEVCRKYCEIVHIKRMVEVKK